MPENKREDFLHVVVNKTINIEWLSTVKIALRYKCEMKKKKIKSTILFQFQERKGVCLKMYQSVRNRKIVVKKSGRRVKPSRNFSGLSKLTFKTKSRPQFANICCTRRTREKRQQSLAHTRAFGRKNPH
jgi:hypothetical protein